MKKVMAVLGLASLLTLTPARTAWAQAPQPGAPTTVTGDAKIYHDPDCTTDQLINPLGTLSVTLQDNAAFNGKGQVVYSANSPLMQASFTVAPAAQATGIFDCMQLHFIQVITQDDCPAKYNGNPLPANGNNAIDPPSGGWDYQQPQGDDTLPWYLNAAEEASPKGNPRSQPGVSYRMSDSPTYCPDGGTTYFTTFIAAESLATCGESDCLNPGNEILLLAGVDWTVSSNGSTVSNVRLATAADAAAFNNGLAASGFANWTAYAWDAKEICCPEPGTCLLVLTGAPVAVVWLRRRARLRAA